MTQFALFAKAPVRSTKPSPEDVRARLDAILAELESADVMPWTESEARRWTTVFPQMCRWLPQDEGEQLIRKFEKQLNNFLRKAA